MGRHKKPNFPKEEVYDWSMNSLGGGGRKPKRRRKNQIYIYYMQGKLTQWPRPQLRVVGHEG